MFTFLTVIGVITLILLIVFAFIKNNVREGQAPDILIALKKKSTYLAIFLVAVIFTLSDGLFMIAKPGTAYALQYLWGGDKAITTQGLKFQMFGRTIPISFEIAIQDTIGRVEPQDEIYYRSAERREFSDAIKADIATSLVISINYQDEELFLQMADKNRSEAKLVHARIIPIYDQVLKNTCKLQTAQEYIAGASTQFDFYLRDQLQHGMYLTEEIETQEDTDMVIGVTDSTSSKRTVTSKGSGRTVKKYRIRLDKSGQPLRDGGNSLSRYGLTVQQAAVTQVDWESAFDQRLDDQKKQVAATQLKKAEAEKEYYSKLAAIQEGEKNKVVEQKKLEMEQIKTTMAAETSVKVAGFKKDEAQNLLNAANLEARRKVVDADADYYVNQKMVSAGLPPERRAYWKYRGDSVISANLASIKLPSTVVISGDQKGGADGLMSTMIGADLAKKMLGKEGN